MTLKLCTSEFMLSSTAGVDYAPTWLPRIVAERFVASTKDGVVSRAPDPIPFIEAELSWTNTSDDPQHVLVSQHSASRTLVSSDPNTMLLADVVSFDVGLTANAPQPVPTDNGFGIRVKRGRLRDGAPFFGRLFADRGDLVTYHEIGQMLPGESLHFRYQCLFSTPGEWRTPPQPKFEAFARWARLRAWASPMVSGI